MNFDVRVKVEFPVIDRGHTRAFYKGLVHGVNIRPALRMLYCQNVPAFLVECEPRGLDEPITCLVCLAIGAQVPKIDGIEVVAEHSALPEGVSEGSYRWVLTYDGSPEHQYVELWVYADVGWRRVS